MRRQQVAELSLFVLLLVLPGCRLRVALRDKPVESVDVRFDRAAMCPGETSQLTIYARLKDGQLLASENTPQGTVRWDSFNIALNGTPVESGEVQIPADPMRVQIPSRLDVGVVGHPQLNTALGVPIHFRCAFVANFYGQEGRDGVEGRDGPEGNKGQDGKVYSVPGKSGFQHDPGGSGTDGRDGSNGGDGEPGRDAEDVEVRVSMAQPSPDLRLLQVKVRGLQSRREQLFLVDPNGGSLTISATGGKGGDGGRGGHGGRGGDAGSGEPKGEAGNGGNGGHGGNGSDGGKGGKISVIVTASAQAHLPALQFSNKGGDPGHPGSPGGSGSGGSWGTNSPRSGRAGDSGQRWGREGPAGPKPEIKVEGN